MPSPLGHMLGGLAAGWAVAGSPTDRPSRAREAILFAGLGAAADLDLLMAGVHRGPTHSVAAALVVGVAVGAIHRLVVSGRRGRIGSIIVAMACAAAYGSHVLLDWLSSDNSAPIGIMALWPYTREYYESDLRVFMAISRRYYHGWTFIWQNLVAISRELAILLPLLSVVMMLRRSQRMR